MKPDPRVLQKYGRDVQRLRTEHGLTQSALARKVRSSKSTISAIECGKTPASPQLRAELDEVLGSGHLVRLWDEITGSGREAWRYEVTELTRRASAIYEYQSMVFPAYLQTEPYAHALIRYGAPWLTPDQAAEQAEERAQGACQVIDADTPKIWLVIDQAVLWRRYGGSEVHRTQLSHIVDLVERERISVRMIPVSTPRHPGSSGPQRIITSSGGDPDVVFVESAHKGQIITAMKDVERKRMIFADTQNEAVGRVETIAAIKEEMERTTDDAHMG